MGEGAMALVLGRYFQTEEGAVSNNLSSSLRTPLRFCFLVILKSLVTWNDFFPILMILCTHLVFKVCSLWLLDLI